MTENLSKIINGKFIFILTAIFAFVSTDFSYSSGIMTAYNDATAHLNTARRMFDSLTPGFVQIGSVWLPLLHLLQLPFVLSDFLFFSGLAGAIVSGLSFVVASVFLYKIIFFVTSSEQISASASKMAALIGCLVFITNGNLLYLQTTAMFEPLLMATILGAVYFLCKWTKTQLITDLVMAAFFTCLATLTRYDGWAFFVAALAYILFVSIWVKKKSKEGVLIVFFALGGLGIGLWLLYNGLIFSNPFYFANSEFSAKAQQDILYEGGMLPARHNLGLSFLTYSISVLLNIGWVAIVVSLVGLFYYGLANYLRLGSTDTQKPLQLAPLLLFVPFVFNILTLYLGQSVIWLPMIEPYFDTYFNARYGVLMLPAVAFFMGYLSSRSVSLKVLCIALVFVQFFLFFNPKYIPVLGVETGIITRQDTVSSITPAALKTSQFLHQNYDGGLILISSASMDSLIFRSQLPLNSFITEGTGKYWKESLENPTKYAKWVVFFKDHTDRVGRNLIKGPQLKQYYNLVYQDYTFVVFKKHDAPILSQYTQ